MAASRETLLVGRIRVAIKKEWPNAWVLKTHGNAVQTQGIPDLLVGVGGRLVGVEVKAQRPGESEAHARGRATLGQLAQLEALDRAGVVGGVVLNADEALELIRYALAQP